MSIFRDDGCGREEAAKVLQIPDANEIYGFSSMTVPVWCTSRKATTEVVMAMSYPHCVPTNRAQGQRRVACYHRGSVDLSTMDVFGSWRK